MGATARFPDAATARCRVPATDGSPDGNAAIVPLWWRRVSGPIGPILAQQPDVVDHPRSLRHWHDRPAGRDLPLYRTPGFAQWHHHSLTHSEHLHGKPHRPCDHAANDCGPDAISISVDRAGG